MILLSLLQVLKGVKNNISHYKTRQRILHREDQTNQMDEITSEVEVNRYGRTKPGKKATQDKDGGNASKDFAMHSRAGDGCIDAEVSLSMPIAEEVKPSSSGVGRDPGGPPTCTLLARGRRHHPVLVVLTVVVLALLTHTTLEVVASVPSSGGAEGCWNGGVGAAVVEPIAMVVGDDDEMNVVSEVSRDDAHAVF